MSNNELDLQSHVLVNGHVIEASAGTGKTYSVAALVVRELAANEDLRIGNILITTFTRAAAGELRDRVRRRIASTAEQLLAGVAEEGDNVVAALLLNEAERVHYVRRLRRAVVEFDTATISTIHAVCTKVLTMAGLPTMDAKEEDITAQLVAQVVNDTLVSEALGKAPAMWDEARLNKLVLRRLDAPTATLWFDPCDADGESIGVEALERLNALTVMVENMAAAVKDLSKQHPSYNDLVRRAAEVLTSADYAPVAKKFAERYTLAFVDEAQDTDDLQWKLFNAIFPKAAGVEGGKLIAVGDPKQAIYAFRGADVYAYLNARDVENMSTLTTNFRSDEPVLAKLNALFDGRSFGDGIGYLQVKASDKHLVSGISGVTAVESVDIADAGNQFELAKATARRVLHLLNTCTIADDGKDVALLPKHVCVLVRSRNSGNAIERELQRFRVPAVSNGTESVFDGETAEHLRNIFVALERVANTGRVRRVAASPFFGYSLTDARLLPEEMHTGDDGEDVVLNIQETLAAWRATLKRNGVAALAGHITSDVAIMENFVAGVGGERRLTDFAHVMDLLHEKSEGRGVSPTQVLTLFENLASLPSSSEVVSRRAESDADAVQVMTMHSAKGLEFPVVVVADLWKDAVFGEPNPLPVYYRAVEDGLVHSERVIDIGWAGGLTSAASTVAIEKNNRDESKRLLYVAMTRAKHHLSLMRTTSTGKPTLLDLALNTEVIGVPNEDFEPAVLQVSINALPASSEYAKADAETLADFTLAASPGAVVQTYRRTSFSGITAMQSESGNGAMGFMPSGSGNEENVFSAVGRAHYAPAAVLTGVHMPLARVTGGTYIGKVLHKVYEDIDTSAENLLSEVERAVNQWVSGRMLAEHRKNIIDGVHLSLNTPLGPMFGERTLGSISPANMLAELDFEMSLAELSKGVMASDIGTVLFQMLPENDPLRPYATMLTHHSFNIPLAGLLNGSIDAVLRLGTAEAPSLFITDYKSNRLDSEDDAQVIDAYAPARLVHAMEHHHYPLQALLYGTCIFRMLRWRAPHLNPDTTIGGVAYFFIRGLVGEKTPVDEAGNPYGVFTWRAPAGLWERLSDLFAGVRP
jgi:exodeoxyribonuclease V beta subunit